MLFKMRLPLVRWSVTVLAYPANGYAAHPNCNREPG